MCFEITYAIRYNGLVPLIPRIGLEKDPGSRIFFGSVVTTVRPVLFTQKACCISDGECDNVKKFCWYCPVFCQYDRRDLEEMKQDILEAEEAYTESLSEPLRKAGRIGEADFVVGIPFENEVDTIRHVCETVSKGLSEFFPDKKGVIVCVGAPEGENALNVIQEVPLGQAIKRIAFLMKNKRVSGTVWSLRAIMEIADRLGANLAVFEADLKSKKVNAEIEGLSPEWVSRLLLPIEKESNEDRRTDSHCTVQ